MITIKASQLKRSTWIRQNIHPIQVVFAGSYGCTYCVKLARLVHNTPECIKHDFNLSPFKIELTQAQAIDFIICRLMSDKKLLICFFQYGRVSTVISAKLSWIHPTDEPQL